MSPGMASGIDHASGMASGIHASGGRVGTVHCYAIREGFPSLVIACAQQTCEGCPIVR
jgi:hypothetical protein